MLKKTFLTFTMVLLLTFPFTIKAQEPLDPPNLNQVLINEEEANPANIALKEDQVLSLEGGAGSEADVFLYLVTTSPNEEPANFQVKADQNGVWSFELNPAPKSGEYTLQAETHQGDQISAKADLLTFKVAKTSVLPTQIFSEKTGLNTYFILSIVLLVLLGLLLWAKRSSKKGK